MSIDNARMETLLRQAPMTIADYMAHAVKYIDDAFGPGYAKENPALVGAVIQASAQDFHTATMLASTQGHEPVTRIERVIVNASDQ